MNGISTFGLLVIIAVFGAILYTANKVRQPGASIGLETDGMSLNLDAIF